MWPLFEAGLTGIQILYGWRSEVFGAKSVTIDDISKFIAFCKQVEKQ